MIGLKITPLDDGFECAVGGHVVLRQTADAPCIFVGRGRADVRMYRGNFDIAERLDERVALRHSTVDGDRVELSAEAGLRPLLSMAVVEGRLTFSSSDSALNRLWFRVPCSAGERFWGAGEQMSYFNLAGRRFPLWTSEPGVGRDKTTLLTMQADATAHAGGDYWNTNYPQPTYLSSRRYALHLQTTAYSCFDFRDPAFAEIECWEIPDRIELFADDSFAKLVGRLAERFGIPPRLPDWAFSGAILGLKDGLRSFDRLRDIVAAGAKVSGLWCEDWVGLRVTSFGQRLFWDWRASGARYPGLRDRIAELAERGVRFLGYVNPYLATDGSLFAEAAGRGYLARRMDEDAPYLVDFGEFDAGIVDFTLPEAADWFAERVIGQEMLDIGMSGWMADFGEYLPVDVRLANAMDGMLAHNAWPTIWAEVNARAVASRGRTGDAVFFMRAGFTGVSQHCPLLWAGDQSVDFSRHDGIGTVITAALSSGLLGNAYHHSDLGGYTSLFGNVRTAELLMRWSELSAFSPVMRSHEGNRPDENLQIDGQADVLAHFVRMTRVHALLAPYVSSLCDEAARTGLPLQRPLFLHHEDDDACYDIEDAYLYGRDLLVAPIVTAGAMCREVYLPGGCKWTHLWSHETFEGGRTIMVEAPFGRPAVFYRNDAPMADHLASLRKTF
jgi:alpha-glucosidase